MGICNNRGMGGFSIRGGGLLLSSKVSGVDRKVKPVKVHYCVFGLGFRVRV